MSTRIDFHRVTEAPTPDSPAVGLHYLRDCRIGLLVPPEKTRKGACWWCEARPASGLPLCVICAEIAWPK